MSQNSLPLSGVRVLDLSRVLAGPQCAMVLGDLGAEVIKIEHPSRGDDTRDWGIKVGETQTAYFNSVNRNKRSVTVDLQSEAGRQLVLDLAKQSDVVIQNFKFGGAEKLGIGYKQMRAVKPDIIYCSIAGYGSNGPEATRPGYDLVVQGESGLMSINGESSQPPLKFGVAVVDMFTGMYSAQAVLAALYSRQNSGEGRHIQMALYDCGVMISSYYGLESLLMEKDPPRFGNAHPSIVPYGVFDAQDGRLVITVGNNSQFQRFCNEVIDRPDLAADPRFETNLKRTEHRTELLAQINAEVAKRPRAQLLQQLTAAGIPNGEVLGIYDALKSERSATAGLLHHYSHPEAGDVEILSPPYRFDDERLPVRRPPPSLGEGTEDVLQDLLGLDEQQVSALRSNGVI